MTCAVNTFMGKKRNKTSDGDAAAPIQKRRRTKSVDETDKAPTVTSKGKLFKVESNRFLKENLSVTVYKVDPFFEDNLPVQFISSSVQSKLAIRAVILNDRTLLQSLIDDVDHVFTVHIKRDFPNSLSAIHYAIQRNNIDLLRLLLKDLKEPKNNRCSFPEVTMGEQSSDVLLQDISEMIFSDDAESILNYAMKNNCSRQIYDLLSETFNCTGYKNVLTCIQSGHRKLAASIITDKQQNTYSGFSKLHHQVLLFDEEDLFVDRVSKVTSKTRGHSELTPIHCAAINSNPKYLKQLLSIVPKYQIADKNRRKPIHFATACEGSEPLEYLLSKNMNLNDVDKDGDSPLHIAVRYDRVKNVEILLRTAKEKAESTDADDQLIYEKLGLASINQTNQSGYCPLHVAAANNHLDCVKILLDYDAQIDIFTGTATDKLTSLMLACQSGCLDIVIYLIEHGARVEARDCSKRTPLIHACMYGQSHIVSYLLRRGANPNVCDSSMNSPLHYATAYGWFFPMKLLIQAGANPNAINSCQMSCLTVAFSKGHFGICDYLLSSCQANINIQTGQGLTLVMIIVNQKISSKVVEQLERVVRNYQADCTLVDINGRNAFHYFASNCQDKNLSKDDFVRIGQILFDGKCNPNQMDNKAQTPLINALQTKNYILVDFFLNQTHIEFNADVCHDGKTFLHYFAIDCENYELTQMLINSSVTDQLKIIAEIRDSQGRTPFHYCLKQFESFCLNSRFGIESLRKKQYQSIVNMIRYFLENIQCDPDLEIKSEQPNIFYLLHTASFINPIDDHQPHPLIIFLEKTKNINVLHHETQRTALIEAIHLKEDSIINILLHHSSCDTNYSTPLILACKFQHLSLIRNLLSNRHCNPLLYDHEHNLALHYYLSTSSRSTEYLEILRLFIEKLKTIDANSLNNQDKLNRTPIHIAIYHNGGSIDVEQILIENQCNLFIQDHLGNLPLHYVFSNICNLTDPIQLCSLISRAMKSQSLDTKNHQGHTPLYLAVAKRFNCFDYVSIKTSSKFIQ